MSGETGRHDVLVLGAGIVGLSVALHLQTRGRDVALLDRGPPGHGTSFGNAGLIERASVVPYAFPRRPATILRHALNLGSDVHHDPLWLPRALPWLARYWWHSAPARLARAARDLLPLIERSVDEHLHLAELADARDLLRPVGLLELFRTPARRDATTALALPLAAAHGLRLDVLDRAALSVFEPRVEEAAIGALHWRDPYSVHDPAALCEAYAALFVRRGGRFATGDALTLGTGADGWRVDTDEGRVHARETVVALGPWTPALIAPLGYRPPLAIKRGYHMHYRCDTPLRRPLLDEAAGFVLVPSPRGIRLSTGVELAAPDAPPNTHQLDRAERVARTLLPFGERLEPTPWLGLRPCLPDMRPVIGAAPRHAGLWFAFGHAHHGLTLGPVTGRLLAGMMTGGKPLVDPAPFDMRRFVRR